MGKIFRRGLGLIVLAAGAIYVWSLFSPWPAALFFRYAMDYGGVRLSQGLERHVPAGVTAILNIRFDESDPDAVMDVFLPRSASASQKPLTTIVWVHGGGFISGDKDQIANYAKIIAAQGYAVIGVNYSLAPGAKYPKPLHQVNTAVAFIVKNALRFHADPLRIVIAGDSAGAHVASQFSAIVSNPDYAKAVGITPALERRQLIGALLFCGVYDGRLLKPGGGLIGMFLRTVGWSFFGTYEFEGHPKLNEFSIPLHVTQDFPSAFISAGNNDPLLPHSIALAEALRAKGVAVDQLFFPKEHQPPLGHEYQFVLDNDAGKLALERMLKFLSGLK